MRWSVWCVCTKPPSKPKKPTPGGSDGKNPRLNGRNRIQRQPCTRWSSQRLDVEIAELDAAVVALYAQVPLVAQQARMLFDAVLVVIEVRIGDRLPVQLDRDSA